VEQRVLWRHHGAYVVGAALVWGVRQSRHCLKFARCADNGGGFELVGRPRQSESVRACADESVAQRRTFDLVHANAGVMVTLRPYG